VFNNGLLPNVIKPVVDNIALEFVPAVIMPLNILIEQLDAQLITLAEDGEVTAPVIFIVPPPLCAMQEFVLEVSVPTIFIIGDAAAATINPVPIVDIDDAKKLPLTFNVGVEAVI